MFQLDLLQNESNFVNGSTNNDCFVVTNFRLGPRMEHLLMILQQ